jgi:hypothetical protein
MLDYILLASHSGLNADPVLFAELITSPTIAIEATILGPNGTKWIRVGWVEAVSESPIGPVSGHPQRLNRGQQEFNLAIPATPYQLRFMPQQWVKNWTIKIYQRAIPPALEPVALDANLIFQKLLDLEAKIDAL